MSSETILMITTFGMLATAMYWLRVHGPQAYAIVPVRPRRDRRKP
jgi:hypothetical protein